MKSSIIFSVLILSLSATIASANTNEPSFTVVAGENANIFKVVYKSASSNRVQVSIRNTKGNVVFSESFNKMNGFTRPYNFDGLPEGEYTIEVKDNQGAKVEKVSYKLGAVKTLMKVTKVGSDIAKYMLTVANNGMNVINVTILNADGDVLFHDAHIVEGDFGIVYNMVKPGTYTFVVTDKSGESQLFLN